MKKDELITLLKDVQNSFLSNPSQFAPHINIKSTGMSISNTGVTGLSISATGGGPGSNTTGLNLSYSVGQVNIEVLQNAGLTDLNEKLQQSLNTLSKLVTEIEAEQLDEESANELVEEMKNKYFPPVITGMILHAIKSFLSA